MKTIHTFNGSRFVWASVIAVVVAELLAWQIRELYRIEINPVVAGFGAVGLVAMVMSLIYSDAG